MILNRISIEYRVGLILDLADLTIVQTNPDMHCTGNKNRTEWNHMLFYPSSIFDPGRLNDHVNKKLNGVEQRIHNLIAAFHLRRAKCSGKTPRI